MDDDDARRLALRATFDPIAERYDRARPGYPEAVVEELLRSPSGGARRVLEIGCGTGQLTVPLAGRGVSVLAVELGPQLAAVARRRLVPYPAAEVVVAAFEDWPLPAEPYDLVVCATAWHWLDPAVRVRKAVAALRPGGALAVISTHHIAGGTSAFFADSQACYLRWDPATERDFRLPTPADVPGEDPQIDESPLFDAVRMHRYEWELSYTTAAFRELHLTYSDVNVLPADARDGLLTCLAELMETRYSGRVVMRYLTQLRVARRR